MKIFHNNHVKNINNMLKYLLAIFNIDIVNDRRSVCQTLMKKVHLRSQTLLKVP
jgi:hypothetical protein